MGSEPSTRKGRCAVCGRTFNLRRAGLNFRGAGVDVGGYYVPLHKSKEGTSCNGARRAPLDLAPSEERVLRARNP